jgi:hypothetical protein
LKYSAVSCKTYADSFPLVKKILSTLTMFSMVSLRLRQSEFQSSSINQNIEIWLFLRAPIYCGAAVLGNGTSLTLLFSVTASIYYYYYYYYYF